MLSHSALQLIQAAFTQSSLQVPVNLCESVAEIKAWAAEEISKLATPAAEG